jgi:hypothetical protein
MSKHTPGPVWTAHDKRPHCHGFSIFAGNEFVAFVGDSDGRTDCASNARLIAAAPELLEALKDLLEWFDDESRSPRPAPLKKARAAIAKAEGNNE